MATMNGWTKRGNTRNLATEVYLRSTGPTGSQRTTYIGMVTDSSHNVYTRLEENDVLAATDGPDGWAVTILEIPRTLKAKLRLLYSDHSAAIASAALDDTD